MRIGIFTDVYRPSINGVVNSIDNFRAEFTKRGHEVYIFAPKVRGARPEKNVFRLPSISQLSPKNFPIGLPFLARTTKIIKKLKLDVIHTQLPFLVGRLGQRFARRFNIPEVHTYHTHLVEYAHYFPSEILQPLIRYGLKRLAKNFCNRSRLVVAPSTAIKELLRSYGVKTAIEVIPSGIKIDLFKRLNAQEKTKLFKEFNIPLGRPIVLYAGRLAEEKNLLFLVECFKRILKTNPKAYLIIAGGGPMEEELKQKIKDFDLTASATVTGYLTYEKIAAFCGAGDVFAFPSKTETQGLVIAEAMAGGTPPVSFKILGPRDLIADGVDGLFAANEKEFEAKIIQLLKNKPLRDKLSENAIDSAKKYSIENCATKLLDAYNSVIIKD